MAGKSSRLVRDIADSLGKLPPQATDLEQAVLGAIMLQKGYQVAIKDLRETYFYPENHRIIFSAINRLFTRQDPIDMKTVVHELRATGQLEIVGGAHYIAELTSKVSSAANIQYHSKIIIEMAVKREMILLASTIHQEAYEDSSDAIELMERMQQSMRMLYESTIVQPKADRIKITWGEVLMEQEPPIVEPLITIDGVSVAKPNGISMIFGKAKTQKSLVVAYMLGEFLKFNSEAALFDTEQGERDVWEYKDRIFRLSMKKIPVFYLRPKNYKERRQIIDDTLKYWPTKFKFIVIDGIRDLLANINDPDQCTDLMEWLLKMTGEHHVHILVILHQNKNDTNPRGHIGTELMNKCETVMDLAYDEGSKTTTVTCEVSRGKPFDTFAIVRTHEDLPALVSAPIKGEVVNDEDRLDRFKFIFKDGLLAYGELIESVKDHFGVGPGTAKKMVAKANRDGWIMSNGPRGGKDTKWKLLIDALASVVASTNGQHKVEEKKPVIPVSDDLPF